jgi:competence protein ComEC
MAAVLTAWCAGIMAAVLLSPLIPWLVLAAVLMAVVALINQRLALLAALCFVAALSGAVRGATVATVELPPGLAGQAIAVSGSVDDDPVDRRGARRLTVRLDHLLTGAGEIASGLRIQAAVYGTTPVHYGDLVLLSGELETPPRFDQFDYRAFLAEQGIAGVMPSAKLVRVTSHAGDPLHTMLFGLRHGVIDAVDRALPEPQAALLLGVVFGYRAALPRQLEQQMIASGLIHIVVISGLKASRLIQTNIRPKAGRETQDQSLENPSLPLRRTGVKVAVPTRRQAGEPDFLRLQGALRPHWLEPSCPRLRSTAWRP